MDHGVMGPDAEPWCHIAWSAVQQATIRGVDGGRVGRGVEAGFRRDRFLDAW